MLMTPGAGRKSVGGEGAGSHGARAAARLADLSGRLNDLVADASHNRRLAALVRQHSELMLRTQGTTLGHPGRASRALAEHRRLLRALEARDPEGAAQAALAHREEARRLRLRLHLERAQP